MRERGDDDPRVAREERAIDTRITGRDRARACRGVGRGLTAMAGSANPEWSGSIAAPVLSTEGYGAWERRCSSLAVQS